MIALHATVPFPRTAVAGLKWSILNRQHAFNGSICLLTRRRSCHRQLSRDEAWPQGWR